MRQTSKSNARQRSPTGIRPVLHGVFAGSLRQGCWLAQNAACCAWQLLDTSGRSILPASAHTDRCWQTLQAGTLCWGLCRGAPRSCVLPTCHWVLTRVCIPAPVTDCWFALVCLVPSAVGLLSKCSCRAYKVRQLKAVLPDSQGCANQDYSCHGTPWRTSCRALLTGPVCCAFVEVQQGSARALAVVALPAGLHGLNIILASLVRACYLS